MKKCLVCGTKFPTQNLCCPSCGWEPVMIDGFQAYAPALAKEGGGFKANYFSDLVQIEEGSFWFRSRNRLIIWAMGKYCSEFKSFIEVGCGTGYVLSAIADTFPESRLHGSEIFTTGLAFAAARQSTINFVQMDARHIPFADEFDAIGAFDVLEHIHEDEQVLAQMHESLKSGGVILLTVPQHAWMWSAVDDYACHVRRYSANDLHNKIEAAGFEILRSTSFVSSLLPAMWISRLLQKGTAENFDVTGEFRIPIWLNCLMEYILNAEVFMIRSGLNFPLGGTRLVVAKKA